MPQIHRPLAAALWMIGSILSFTGMAIAGRAVAIDPSQHRYGDLLWIDAGAPVLTGSFPLYQRMVSALDTGGAIKGEVRADLYLGRGDAPGLEAGRIRHNLTLYRLHPRTQATQ